MIEPRGRQLNLTDRKWRDQGRARPSGDRRRVARRPGATAEPTAEPTAKPTPTATATPTPTPTPTPTDEADSQAHAAADGRARGDAEADRLGTGVDAADRVVHARARRRGPRRADRLPGRVVHADRAGRPRVPLLRSGADHRPGRRLGARGRDHGRRAGHAPTTTPSRLRPIRRRGPSRHRPRTTSTARALTCVSAVALADTQGVAEGQARYACFVDVGSAGTVVLQTVGDAGRQRVRVRTPRS